MSWFVIFRHGSWHEKSKNHDSWQKTSRVVILQRMAVTPKPFRCMLHVYSLYTRIPGTWYSRNELWLQQSSSNEYLLYMQYTRYFGYFHRRHYIEWWSKMKITACVLQSAGSAVYVDGWKKKTTHPSTVPHRFHIEKRAYISIYRYRGDAFHTKNK